MLYCARVAVRVYCTRDAVCCTSVSVCAHVDFFMSVYGTGIRAPRSVRLERGHIHEYSNVCVYTYMYK